MTRQSRTTITLPPSDDEGAEAEAIEVEAVEAEVAIVRAYRDEDDLLQFTVTLPAWLSLCGPAEIAYMLHAAADSVRLIANEESARPERGAPVAQLVPRPSDGE